MVNSLLFRWEDSQALQHHCGFCERPLSHPGARASCFGTHSEPCHRFHQTMFMRNRAHICNYCSTIDEAHYKRHHELALQLRNIYESYGEDHWTIVPAEPEDPRRDRPVHLLSANSESSDRGLTPEEASSSKRERKDAKCLVRAASRTKVITQEEIKYIDSVLHTPDVSGGDGDDPANLEEMQLIESHLRYNANVYNRHASRRDLRKFAKIPDVDVDFDAEMERVLETFRITELVKRNLRNRGVQARELREFESSVAAFKAAVVEDLVLVKKDTMEIRMRRAGYLRYTSKTAYEIVEDRYTDKDWKTGERIMSSSSDSSSLASSSEELSVLPMKVHNDVVLPASLPAQGPDRRHLQHIHTRISGQDGLAQSVIEPYHAPLLPMSHNQVLRKPAVLNLKISNDKKEGFSSEHGWLRHTVARQTPSNQTLKPPSSRSSKPPSSEAIKPAWSCTTLKSSLPVRQGLAFKPLNVDLQDFPALRSASEHAVPNHNSLAVQAPIEVAGTGLREPERTLTPENDTNHVQPIVSQKKAKKAQREAKRKAQKQSSKEMPSDSTLPFGVDCVEPAQVFYDTPVIDSTVEEQDTEDNMAPHCYAPEVNGLLYDVKAQEDAANLPISVEQTQDSALSLEHTPAIIPCTTSGKHDHWMRFERVFVVDHLTIPLLQSPDGCSHGSSCLFETHGVLDCPFHEPNCTCCDPLQNLCHLVHPGNEPSHSGPYNRVHGDRILSLFEKNGRTKGRVMLVDSEIVGYLQNGTNMLRTPVYGAMPSCLMLEHMRYQQGYQRGPLMQQVADYERMFCKNALRHPLTADLLEKIQTDDIGCVNATELCYCHVTVHNIDGVATEWVSCSYNDCEFGGMFHKRCVKNLGVEMVSRWYCTSCALMMKAVAHNALDHPFHDDTVARAAAKIMGEMIATSGGVVNLRQALRDEMGSGDVVTRRVVTDLLEKNGSAAAMLKAFQAKAVEALGIEDVD